MCYHRKGTTVLFVVIKLSALVSIRSSSLTNVPNNNYLNLDLELVFVTHILYAALAFLVPQQLNSVCLKEALVCKDRSWTVEMWVSK